MIVFLNGTSSSGKTSIAKALQERLGPEWLHSGAAQIEAAVPG